MMLILRVLKSTYELFDATDVVRLAKSSVRNMAALGLATRMIDGAGDLVEDTPVFVGSAFEPSASGADNTVDVQPGIAFLYDTSEADVWLGEVGVVFSDAVDTVAFSTNNDGSGDDRIDVLSLQPVEVEEDEETRKFKDPSSGTISEELSPQRTRVDYEFVVTEGTPAASPSAPATPAGTYKVAEVLRPNGQTNVLSGDVTDSRNLDRVRGGIVEAFNGLATRTDAVYLGDPDGDHYKIVKDDDTSPTVLRIRDQAGAEVDLDAGELYGDTYVSVRSVLRFGDRAVSDSNRLEIGADSALIPDTLTVAKGDGTIGDLVHAKSVRAFGYYNFTGGTLSEIYAEGLGTVTDNAAGDWDIAIDPDLDSANAIALVSFMNTGGAGYWISSIVASVSQLSIECTDNGGTNADPPAGTRIAVAIIGGH